MQTEPSLSLSNYDWREELTKERKKNDELNTFLKNQERNYQKLIGELKTQIQAEQKKCSSLEGSLQKVPYSMEQVIDLQSQLKQAELRQKALIEEFKQKSAETEAQHKEALSKTMTKELTAFKDYAINEITEKEKIIIEQKLIIDKSESTIQSLAQDVDYFQSLIITEKQKGKYEIEEYKEKIQELEEELFELREKREDAKTFHTRSQDEALKNEKTDDENRKLKLFMENLQEELELRTADLSNAEKKINQLKDSRQELAVTIEKLENRIEQLMQEKDEIAKGLQSKEEAIQLLEEEMYSNAEGIDEKYKSDLEIVNTKCKRLEKKLREMEQSYEDQLEEKMGLIAVGQIKINDLNRKLVQMEKDKDGVYEKLQKALKEIQEFDGKLEESKRVNMKENEKFKEKLVEKITSLKNEREELRMKINELQEMSFSRVSMIEPGGSLFDEFQQLPEGRYSRISLKAPGFEDTKRIEGLISQLAEKETTLRNLWTEKISLESNQKEVMMENKNLQQELSVAIRHSQNLSQELELAKWELDNLRSSEDSKLDKGKILVLESEKELLKAEISRLETELMLSKENWAELNNSLTRDLLESQTVTAQAKSELIRLREEYENIMSVAKEKSMHTKKKSWFGRRN